jgi:hypothetical protein
MNGNAQLQLLPYLDGNGLSVAVQVCTLSHHMQRVEQLSHEGRT